jgi:MarR family transcriptional regulator, 2-MHQ and catechol-resistance regulon repressor
MPDSSGTHLWLVLMKAHRALGRHAKLSISSNEIGSSDFTILEALLHKGPMLVSEAGRLVHLTSGATTTAVDRLEVRGLVARGSAASDRRATVVTLTRQGRALITKIFDRHRTNMDVAASSLTSTERQTLITLLKKVGTTADTRLDPPTLDRLEKKRR